MHCSLSDSKMERWYGKVALVTGASAGIGAGICRTLVQHGMIVVGCARSVDKIRAICEVVAVKTSPGKLVAIKCDLTQESEIKSMFDEILRTFGRLDLCVNNAGLGHYSPLLTGNTTDWRNMLDINVIALCICTQEAVKLMRGKGIDDGQIINILGLDIFRKFGTVGDFLMHVRFVFKSLAGHRLLSSDLTGLDFYCGTKFMVKALTEGLRRELKSLNSRIKISSLSPGLTETEFIDRYLKNDGTPGAFDFKSTQALRTEDVADSLLHILRTPPHVEVHDILVLPVNNNI